MTPTDAANVLGLLTAAWPNQDMPDRTVDLWIGLLTELEADDAKAAAKTVVREDQWFPSVARFLQAAQAAKHARRNREAARRGLPDGHRATELPAELIAATRGLIEEREGKKHNHFGPSPCPVCGGMAEPKKEKSE